MMIPIIYINPNGSGIGGKAIIPPLVVFHLRIGDNIQKKGPNVLPLVKILSSTL